jgi:hypothetical protein
VTNATVVFVIIGPNWLKLLQERREGRVDHVRKEIDLAIDTGRHVVPVLVQNASRPSETDLADFSELLDLPSLNARLLRPEPDFDNDFKEIVAHLCNLDPPIINCKRNFLRNLLIASCLIFVGLAAFLSYRILTKPNNEVIDLGDSQKMEFVRIPKGKNQVGSTDSPFALLKAEYLHAFGYFFDI